MHPSPQQHDRQIGLKRFSPIGAICKGYHCGWGTLMRYWRRLRIFQWKWKLATRAQHHLATKDVLQSSWSRCNVPTQSVCCGKGCSICTSLRHARRGVNLVPGCALNEAMTKPLHPVARYEVQISKDFIAALWLRSKSSISGRHVCGGLCKVCCQPEWGIRQVGKPRTI